MGAGCLVCAACLDLAKQSRDSAYEGWVRKSSCQLHKSTETPALGRGSGLRGSWRGGPVSDANSLIFEPTSPLGPGCGRSGPAPHPPDAAWCCAAPGWLDLPVLRQGRNRGRPRRAPRPGRADHAGESRRRLSVLQQDQGPPHALRVETGPGARAAARQCGASASGS